MTFSSDDAQHAPSAVPGFSMPPHHVECGCKMTRRDSSQENRGDCCKEWQGSPRTGARLVRWRAFAPGTVSGLGVAQPRLPPSPRSRNSNWGRAASIVVYAFTDMLLSSQAPVGHIVILATLALCVFATPVSGQDRRWFMFGTAGVVSIGHADSGAGKGAGCRRRCCVSDGAVAPSGRGSAQRASAARVRARAS